MKKFISLFMSFVMLLGITAGLNLSVYAETSGDFEYKILDDGTAEITDYTGSADNLVIPSTIDEYTVTSIGNYAFANCSKLTNITIPNSVTSIGESAFGSCSSLTNITIPNSVTSIGESAFCYCDNLTSITIPSSVTSIGQKAFLYCAGLTGINVDSGNTVYSSDNGVLFNKDKSKLIQCPVGSSITSYDVPNSVTTICNNAFYRCTGLLSITIPNGVTSIGEEAFYCCSSLKNITIPNGVTSIGEYTFGWCEGLKSITISDSVASIGQYAFCYCSSLKRIIIPDSVANIDQHAFYYCSSLTDVYFTGSEEQWSAVSIGFGNDNLSNANKHFNFKPCEEHTVAFDDDVPATCKDTGLTEGSHCSVCGDILVEQTVIPKLPHGRLIEKRKNYVAPTCTKGGGYDVEYYCSVCNEAVKGGHITLDPIDHNYNSGTVIKNATCTSSGVKLYTCTECGSIKTEIIAMQEHIYETTVTKATTSENGSIVTKCSACGEVNSKSTLYYPKTITLSTTSYTYDGKEKNPSVKVVGSNGETISSSNYTVSYASGRKYAGKYAVKITFKDNYSGSKTLYFTIKPKGTSISKLTATSKGFNATWKKQTNQTTGYQIQYSTSSKFTSSTTKTVTVSKNSTASKKFSKLKAKKKYYVRVRTYKTVKVNGKSTKIYSSWSKVKSVKTK